jgi:hypothetical protein
VSFPVAVYARPSGSDLKTSGVANMVLAVVAQPPSQRVQYETVSPMSKSTWTIRRWYRWNSHCNSIGRLKNSSNVKRNGGLVDIAVIYIVLKKTVRH